jgi:hypothetical protein
MLASKQIKAGNIPNYQYLEKVYRQYRPMFLLAFDQYDHAQLASYATLIRQIADNNNNIAKSFTLNKQLLRTALASVEKQPINSYMWYLAASANYQTKGKIELTKQYWHNSIKTMPFQPTYTLMHADLGLHIYDHLTEQEQTLLTKIITEAYVHASHWRITMILARHKQPNIIRDWLVANNYPENQISKFDKAYQHFLVKKASD